MIHTDNFSIQFKHDRTDNGDRYTKCVITTTNSSVDGIPTINIAFAKCSKNDNFCKKTGRLLSFNRARKMIYDEDERMIITKAFNQHEGYPFNE